MVDKEVEDVPKEEVKVEEEEDDDDVIEITAQGKRKKTPVKTEKKSRVRKPNKHVEDWLKLLPRSSNAISTNDHIFRDPHALVRDVECPRTDGFELFIYFYENKTYKVPICNPWNRNIANLICPEVFIDVDLVKALIKSYNLVTRNFHRHNGSFLCTLVRTSFIDAFKLEGQMDTPIDTDDLQKKFANNKTYFVNNVMMPHIPYNVKKEGKIPRSMADFLPLSRFKYYFRNIVYGLLKVLGSDGVEDCVYGSLFLMACDI